RACESAGGRVLLADEAAAIQGATHPGATAIRPASSGMRQRMRNLARPVLPIVREQPLGLDLRPMYLAAIPRRPLQFTTLDLFCEVAGRAMAQDVETRGLSPLTLRWWEQSLRVFAHFLRTNN